MNMLFPCNCVQRFVYVTVCTITLGSLCSTDTTEFSKNVEASTLFNEDSTIEKAKVVFTVS